MRITRIAGRRLLVVAAILGALAAGALAQAQGGLRIDWWTVDGGGGSLSDGAYVLDGTAGQADAGLLSGGDLTLAGGFWGGIDSRRPVYLPLLTR